MARVESTMAIDEVVKTSQLINDGENGTGKFIEDSEISKIIENVELLENKQDSLLEDGTGTKYPTVDAINEALKDIKTNDTKYFNFNNVNEVVCIHLLNKIPSVTVLIGTEEVIANIEHTPDMNECTIRFSQNYTGQIIIQ